MADMTFEITEHVFSMPPKGNWTKELNKIRWNGREAVYDFRGWNADHSKMTKGITLTAEEFEEFKSKINNI